MRADLVEHLRGLEADLVSPAVWQSRAELEARLCPDFIEIGSAGVLDREGLISIILGTDPGLWHAEDFVVRQLATTVALVTYRSAIDQGEGSAQLVAMRSSIWQLEDDRWRMAFHQVTRVSGPSA